MTRKLNEQQTRSLYERYKSGEQLRKLAWESKVSETALRKAFIHFGFVKPLGLKREQQTCIVASPEALARAKRIVKAQRMRLQPEDLLASRPWMS